MGTVRWKTFLMILAAGSVLALLAAACGGSEPEELEIPVKVEGESLIPDRVEVRKGDMVTLKIEADDRGEFHLHGYDIEKEVEAGVVTDFFFVAETEGRFKITFHRLEEEGGDEDHEKEGNGEDDKDEEHAGEEEVEIGIVEVRPR